MIPGISSQIFYPHRLTPSHLDALAASGARTLELFAARFHFDYSDRQLLRDTAAWFRSSDCTPTLHAPLTADSYYSRHATPSLNLVANEKPRRIEAMEEIKRALESAEHIPFATCVLHLGLDGDPWSDYALEYALTAVEHLKAFAGPLGVRLLLENLRNDVATPGHLLDILRIGHFDSTGICFDVGHAFLTGHLEAQTFALLRAKLTELHLHDNFGPPLAGVTYPGNPGKPDAHLWPASGTERPSTLATGSIAWREIYALIATLPAETPAILEVSDTQAPDPEFVTRTAREVFSHAARLTEIAS
jgi:sugar phosphate isomerase/epimerase